MTMSRVLTLFEELCDLDDESVQNALASESNEVRARVLGMIAADRTGAAIDEDQVAWALADDMIDELSDLPRDWTPPRAVDGVALTKELGRGGMGVVFEGHQSNPERRIAVKFLGPAYADAAQEAKSLAALRHPAIPIIFQVGEVDGAVYLLMEHVDGVELLDWIAHRTLSERLTLFLALCDAVVHAHDAGILHRDLKPSNLLVDGNRAWVLDFGLAQVEGTNAKGVVGTLPYVADEVLAGGPATQASDVFSLGIVLAEMLGGPRPTRGSRGSLSRQRQLRAARPPQAWDHHPIPELNSLVQRAVAPVEQRYPTVRDLAADVQRYLDRVPMQAYPGGWGYRARLLVRRRPLATAAAAALVLVGTGMVGWRVQQVWAAEKREALAELQLSRVLATVDDAIANQDLERAESALDNALLDDAVRGTLAASDALRHLGRALDGAGASEAASRRWVQAHLETSDAERRVAPMLDLQDALVKRKAWSGLAQLAEILPVEQGLKAHRLAAIAQRRNPGGDQYKLFDKATRSSYRPRLAVVSGESLQLFEVSTGQIHVVDLSLRPRFTVPAPAKNVTRAVATETGAFWLAALDDGAGVWHLSNEGILTHLVHLPGSGPPLAADLVRLDDQGEVLLLSTGAPNRAVVAIDPSTGEVWSPDPVTDAVASDILDMGHLDVDADGTDEAVFFSSAWRAYDVRIHDGDRTQLSPTHRGRTGGVARGTVVEREGGDWLVVRKDDGMANELVFDASPAGVAAGVYVLRPTEDTFEVVDSYLVPHLGWPAEKPVVGDFNGDGYDDVVFSVGHRDLAQWVFLGPDGILDIAWTENLVALAAADVNGDGRDELYARLPDDEHHLWIAGVGDGPLPGGKLPTIAAVDIPGLGAAGLMLRLGLFDAATTELEEQAVNTRDPVRAAEVWSLAAFNAKQDGKLARAQRSLERAVDLAPGRVGFRAELIDILRQRQVFDVMETGAVVPGLPAIPPTVVDFANDGVLSFDIHNPAPITATVAGLQVRGTGGDGVLLSVPVHAVGPHHAVTLDLDLRVAELGAVLEVVLLDEAGGIVQSIGLEPYGGIRTLDRSVRCGGALGGGAGLYGGLVPQHVVVERFVLRLSHLAGSSRCQLERNGVSREGIWTADHGTPGTPASLVVRFRNVPGYESSLIEATLRSLTIEGLRFDQVEHTSLHRWVTGELHDLPEALSGTSVEPLWHARQGDIAAARATHQLANEALWTPMMRRDPLVWLLALVDEPELLASRYARAWRKPHTNSALAEVLPSLDHPLVDRFPLETEDVLAMLQNRLRLLNDQGRPDRALTLLRRLPADEVDALEGARILQSAGQSVEASRWCERALTERLDVQVVRDMIAIDPRLVEACGTPGNNTLIDGSKP